MLLASSRTPASPSRPAREPARPLRRILVVENDRDLRRLLGRLLSRAGYEPLACEGVEAACEALGRGEAELVLADAVLPGTTPGAFLAEVERLSPGTPVVLMTGRLDSELVRHGIDPSRIRLRKPFGWNELVMAVRDALR